MTTLDDLLLLLPDNSTGDISAGDLRTVTEELWEHPGPTGAKGDQGDTGDTGAKGDQGDAGPKGDTGDAGPKGDTGNTGDTGAQGIPGAGWITGAGPPEGVRVATVGTMYSDTAATNGAAVWVKATGVGNTGWQVAYGDTGWRDMTATATNLDPANIGKLRLRRVGKTVYVGAANLLLLAGSGTAAMLVPPAGFRPSGNGPYVTGYWPRANSLASVSIVGITAASLSWMAENAVTTGAGTTAHPPVAMHGQTAFLTEDPWPTGALPGS